MSHRKLSVLRTALLVAGLALVAASLQTAAVAQTPPSTEAQAQPSVITMPQWARPPQPEFPRRAFARDAIEGHATIGCAVLPNGRLRACRITEEDPVGLGFGIAAVAAAQDAQLSLQDNGVAPDAQVSFTTRFRLPARRSTIENPAWTQPPRPTFPSSAQHAGIESARVRLDCAVTPAGRLRQCVIQQEDPGHLGFGEAAVRAARGARVLPSALYDTTPDVRAVFDVVFGD